MHTPMRLMGKQMCLRSVCHITKLPYTKRMSGTSPFFQVLLQCVSAAATQHSQQLR